MPPNGDWWKLQNWLDVHSLTGGNMIYIPTLMEIFQPATVDGSEIPNNQPGGIKPWN